MERKRFAYCLAVSAALILLFGRLDVYVPAAVKDPQRATLHKSLKNMACDETTVFIQDKFLSSTSGVTKRVKEEAARAKAGTCEQEKQFIFNFISKQLPDVSGGGHIGTKSWFSFPPSSCLSCLASVCLAHDQCDKCCRKRHSTFCYDCR
ncbi:hypothetical protein MPTK1_2g03150 [Marchantia polymorpha subsp. ruderalis]|uniref:Uncharacterized protein n=1 Tax=Marchantia polymorpha TaxID=3197 RepID=A0A2R6WMA0_MARPO|nr:hypothetical protein MARPO_0075s0076 [Marchantia polymorpha]BBN00925.1 hypothetical protein Mp_2g03150 [Marchantia polymorpha subsp. ruderalis]|eukprot:PTQ34979.1 hypothetical protein MARPO_0075s0076 [Marchantia polymorpha]